MKYDVPWLFLSESVECPFRKIKQFSKRSLGEICSQRLTTSHYLWN